jgi:hypothetical protein
MALESEPPAVYVPRVNTCPDQHPDPRSTGRFIVGGAILMLSLIAAAGCQFKGGGDTAAGDGAGDAPSNATQPSGEAPSSWQPSPTRLKIYPATQFIERDGEPMLKASIELLDALGDSIKAPGHLRCELYARGQYGAVGDRLYRWDIPIRTLKQQRQYFDLVTRTYVLRLSMDSPQATEKPTMLRVTFTRPNGPRLQTERALPIEW